jgi:Spy/CpxP family protein refolding chaperone
MTSHRSFRTIAGVAAFALATAFGSYAAFAQPAGGPHSHHGMAGPDEMIGHLIASAKPQLNLNTSQQSMFDTAVADSKVAFQSGQALRQKIHDTLQAELAKTEPDLAAVATAADAAMDQGRTQRKTIRAEWLALYATFTPDQKAVVKDLLQKHMAQADSFREKMREHFKSSHGGVSG